MTAHFLGGAVISGSPDRGVIDPYHRVWSYPGLHIVDGAAISANLGVNLSLTITAQAERAMSLWPVRGAQDERPAQGEPYRMVRGAPAARGHCPPATARRRGLRPAAYGTAVCRWGVTRRQLPSGSVATLEGLGQLVDVQVCGPRARSDRPFARRDGRTPGR